MGRTDVEVALQQLARGSGVVLPSELAAQLGWSVPRTQNVLAELLRSGQVRDRGIAVDRQERQYEYLPR
jgi:hypothetical protein